METFLSICVGVGLSAACGFRVFVPLFLMSLASLTGHLNLAMGFAWIGTWPALIAFGVATVLEIAGYYIPWMDHFLDTVATPAAVVAGTIVTASVVTDLSPFLKWTLAVIAGGGAAGFVQAGTVVARATSFMGTGGLANGLVATAELTGSVFASLMAFLAPVMAVALVLVAGVWVGRKRLLTRKRVGGCEGLAESEMLRR